IAVSKIKKWLEDNNLDSDAKIYQSKIADELNKFDDYDVVVSTTVVPDSVKEKVINGVALLTGVGIDKVFEQIRKELEK
ncbi:TPA: PTS galactitol transporter subunit IIB, partial [Streptococcus pneumoniae]